MLKSPELNLLVSFESCSLRFKKLTLDVKLVLKLAKDSVPAGCSFEDQTQDNPFDLGLLSEFSELSRLLFFLLCAASAFENFLEVARKFPFDRKKL